MQRGEKFSYSVDPLPTMSCHRSTQGVRGVRGDDIEPPSQIKKNLVNKNTMKPKMVFHLRFCPKSIDPLCHRFWQKFEKPLPGIFSLVHLWFLCKGSRDTSCNVMYDENTWKESNNFFHYFCWHNRMSEVNQDW